MLRAFQRAVPVSAIVPALEGHVGRRQCLQTSAGLQVTAPHEGAVAGAVLGAEGAPVARQGPGREA